MAGSPVWDACFFVYYFMDEEKVMNEREKVNQITEGVIWKQLLLFFFPIVFGTFFQQIYKYGGYYCCRPFRRKTGTCCSWRFCQSDRQSDRWLFVGFPQGQQL